MMPVRDRRNPQRAMWVVYSWLSVSLEQEQQACDALVNLGWLENDHALHAEGVRVIRELLECSTDDAKAILHDLRARKLIDVTITPGGELDIRKSMPLAQLRWVRSRTSTQSQVGLPLERILARFRTFVVRLARKR